MANLVPRVPGFSYNRAGRREPWERGCAVAGRQGGRMVSASRNAAVLGSSPALATCWICSRSSRVQILGRAYK